MRKFLKKPTPFFKKNHPNTATINSSDEAIKILKRINPLGVKEAKETASEFMVLLKNK